MCPEDRDATNHLASVDPVPHRHLASEHESLERRLRDALEEMAQTMIVEPTNIADIKARSRRQVSNVEGLLAVAAALVLVAFVFASLTQ